MRGGRVVPVCPVVVGLLHPPVVVPPSRKKYFFFDFPTYSGARRFRALRNWRIFCSTFFLTFMWDYYTPCSSPTATPPTTTPPCSSPTFLGGFREKLTLVVTPSSGGTFFFLFFLHRDLQGDPQNNLAESECAWNPPKYGLWRVTMAFWPILSPVEGYFDRFWARWRSLKPFWASWRRFWPVEGHFEPVEGHFEPVEGHFDRFWASWRRFWPVEGHFEPF